MMTRRAFLERAAGAALLPAAMRAAIDNTQPMKIDRIDAVTFRKDLHVGGGSGGSDGAEFCWVRLHTDSGLIGTGETYPFHQGEVGALRDYAPTVIGRDPRDIDGLWRAFFHRMAMRNTGGADMRILSAINMAQLDVLGQASGLPLYRLLGGKTRQRVRVYNTTTDYWAINETKMGRDTMKIVRFLLDRGITAMKIYPFSAPDHYLSNKALETGMSWIREIRDQVGNEMDICVDLWGRFDLPSAARIAKALEPYLRRHRGAEGHAGRRRSGGHLSERSPGHRFRPPRRHAAGPAGGERRLPPRHAAADHPSCRRGRPQGLLRRRRFGPRRPAVGSQGHLHGPGLL